MIATMPLTVDVFGVRHAVADVTEIPSSLRPGTVGLVEFRPRCNAFGAMVATPAEASRWVSIVEPVVCPACTALRAQDDEDRARERA